MITIDAMGTQTVSAAQIYNASADYVLALKANHSALYGQVEAWFEQAQTLNFEGINFSYNERVEKNDKNGTVATIMSKVDADNQWRVLPAKNQGELLV